ncbi:hypothetical protein [Bradyrhizobium sp. Leo121]|uniref:hypothetical protein n=1 Tax=Bradyrhizobium sp. Leo121 TaxID=1571195 RepID=UPI0010EF5745|nr:hypothetical protein [Bradyrhizobium sp. Leo121]RZN13694.1 hypothetical protein CWO90_44390 [Bradyrhizobium sp. Leo121]
MLRRAVSRHTIGHSIFSAIDIGRAHAALGFALITDKEIGRGIYGSVPRPRFMLHCFCSPHLLGIFLMLLKGPSGASSILLPTLLL